MAKISKRAKGKKAEASRKECLQMVDNDPKTKAGAQRLHAIRRAGERYVDFDASRLFVDMCRLIQGRGTFCLRRTSQRLTHHAGVIDGRLVLCVYDKNRCQVVSFLPRYNIKMYADRLRQASSTGELPEWLKPFVQRLLS